MQSLKCPHCRGSGVVSPENEAVGMGVVPGTRHHQLLNSNELPEEHEEASIRSFASSAATRLVLLDDEIRQLWDQLEQLMSERDSVSSFHVKTRAILSPLRRMPSEILSEIFRWTLPAARDAPQRRGFRAMESPWVLTHVCRRWRSVSIPDPSLWSFVPIGYGPEMDPSSAYPLPMIKTHIARAGKLKIHFYAHPSCDPGPQVELFALLSQHSTRWEELSLGLSAHLIPVLASVRNCLPSLRRVHVQCDFEDDQAGIESWDYFREAPRLTDVTIFNEWRFITVDLPIHNLTRYLLLCPWPHTEPSLPQQRTLSRPMLGWSSARDPGPTPTILLLCHFCDVSTYRIPRSWTTSGYLI
ncbi:hypothetical protein C8R47DRAFT_149694 [Mycena vitilis]|nr:hypothetical protein C8R47DRAFT_149694 [Mycena vitilis]